MFHSIKFGVKPTPSTEVWKNTWNDWHLIPSSRPDVELPSRKTNYVDIPGRDGSLDMTEYLTGKAGYSDRNGTWEFIVVQEYDGINVDVRTWLERKAELLEFFETNSGSVKAILEDDQPDYYYVGRVFLDQNAWKTGKNFSTVTFSYRFEPFKRNLQTGEEAGL